jgi:hypothetical protein
MIFQIKVKILIETKKINGTQESGFNAIEADEIGWFLKQFQTLVGASYDHRFIKYKNTQSTLRKRFNSYEKDVSSMWSNQVVLSNPDQLMLSQIWVLLKIGKLERINENSAYDTVFCYDTTIVGYEGEDESRGFTGFYYDLKNAGFLPLISESMHSKNIENVIQDDMHEITAKIYYLTKQIEIHYQTDADAVFTKDIPTPKGWTLIQRKCDVLEEYNNQEYAEIIKNQTENK